MLTAHNSSIDRMCSAYVIKVVNGASMPSPTPRIGERADLPAITGKQFAKRPPHVNEFIEKMDEQRAADLTKNDQPVYANAVLKNNPLGNGTVVHEERFPIAP